MITILCVVVLVLFVALIASMSRMHQQEEHAMLCSSREIKALDENFDLRSKLAEKDALLDYANEVNASMRNELQDLKVANEKYAKELSAYKKKELKNKEQLRIAREKRNQNAKNSEKK